MKAVAVAYIAVASVFFLVLETLAILTVIGLRDGSRDVGSPLAAAVLMPVVFGLILWLMKETWDG